MLPPMPLEAQGRSFVLCAFRQPGPACRPCMHVDRPGGSMALVAARCPLQRYNCCRKAVDPTCVQAFSSNTAAHFGAAILRCRAAIFGCAAAPPTDGAGRSKVSDLIARVPAGGPTLEDHKAGPCRSCACLSGGMRIGSTENLERCGLRHANNGCRFCQ